MSPQPLTEPVAFGHRYRLTDLLAVGGMAEIYLARQAAMAGFEKTVVIKRLKPDLTRDKRIVEMFLDEARIGAILEHPSIVHVYDVDEHQGVPYIAMEYIRGEELNALCRRGLAVGRFLPMPHAVEIVRQTAAGMGYFHAKRTAQGRHLEIVHCDISPSNLLVTEDGFLKIIDFGIARAKNQRYRDEGAIPGKLSYMAPEQAARERVDHRSDIFSLGVVLYEITVGRRLFKGPAGEVVKRLAACEIAPPTFVNQGFPGALEVIIMRALERYPDDRYQSAYDLADDLEEFLRNARARTGPVRIARYLDELSLAAGGVRRPELIAEDELDADDDALDFDRARLAADESVSEVSGAEQWDEYEEDDAEVAAALGLELSQFQRVHTPVPARLPGKDASGDSMDGVDGTGGVGGVDDLNRDDGDDGDDGNDDDDDDDDDDGGVGGGFGFGTSGDGVGPAGSEGGVFGSRTAAPAVSEREVPFDERATVMTPPGGTARASEHRPGVRVPQRAQTPRLAAPDTPAPRGGVAARPTTASARPPWLWVGGGLITAAAVAAALYVLLA